MANILNVPVHKVILFNLAYEFFAYWTSIITHDSKGNVIHARNMDFELHRFMANSTYTADFYKNDKVLFRATMFAGQLGVFTAMKPGKFTVCINQRNIDIKFKDKLIGK